MMSLEKISPCFRHLIATLIRNGKIGICGTNARVSDIQSGSLTSSSGPKGDRFQVYVPYAGQTLTWEVILDQNFPKDPPDFLFNEEDFEFSPSEEDVPSLANWDLNNPCALLDVINEMLSLYRSHQQHQLALYSRLHYEYSSLIEQTDLQPDDIEIFVHKTETKVGPIVFLVKMTADFSKLPAYLIKDNPGDDSAVLLVSFSSPSTSRISPQLYLSPRLENALGKTTNLRIPPFPSGGVLCEYVPLVSQLLCNKIEQILTAHEKKKEYVASFLSQFGRSLLEYDAETFSRVSFLFEWNDFFFILHIEIPPCFPQDPPEFTFQSIYHENKGKPFSSTVNDYPYSPRWTGNKMADIARAYILENIGAFQKASVLSGSL